MPRTDVSTHVRPILLLIALTTLAVAGCDGSSSVNVQPRVNMQDQCDSASFNAALGAGACIKAGNITLSQFNAELSASKKVAEWQFVPATMTIHVGQTITAMNAGGETHTFTEVANFGGGVVPSLNNASGNPNEAPECAAITAVDRVAPGGSFTADAATDVGTEHYQCCIHPWMRATVTVVK